jgi:hypothetical protein
MKLAEFLEELHERVKFLLALMQDDADNLCPTCRKAWEDRREIRTTLGGNYLQ